MVFGTAFAPAEVEGLKKASGGRVSLTVCDITKPEAVKAWPMACPMRSATQALMC